MWKLALSKCCPVVYRNLSSQTTQNFAKATIPTCSEWNSSKRSSDKFPRFKKHSKFNRHNWSDDESYDGDSIGFQQKDQDKTYYKDIGKSKFFRNDRSTFDDGRDSYLYPKKDMSDSYGRGDSNNGNQHNCEKNANLTPIGVPNKWKVGPGFLKEADRLRNRAKSYRDFHKIGPTKRDPGIRKQLKALGSEEEDIYPEEVDQEVDPMHFDKAFDIHMKEKEAYKQQVKRKIIHDKYFKKDPTEKRLSWSEKEQIRHLYNTDPKTWTFEAIAEQFKIDVDVARAVAKAKWLPSKPKPSEEFSPAEEVFPLTETSKMSGINEKLAWSSTEQMPDEDERKRFTKSNRMMTWKELSKEMGTSEDEVKGAISTSPEALTQPDINEGDQELLLKYLSKEGSSSKWAPSTSAPELKVDVDDSSSSANVYYYDSKHGYQHPFGKEVQSGDNNGEMVKDGDLYRKGDSFYTEDGEFLYKVPGLNKA